MIPLFDQKRKYYNQNNKILQLVSHMALQTVPLIGTMETLNSVPASSDKLAQLLTTGNFEIIWNALCVIISVTVHKKISHKLTIINSRVNYFEATRMIQTSDTCPFLLSLQRTIIQFLTKKNLNCMYSWNCIHVWNSFFSSILYMLLTIKVGRGSLFLWTDYEGRT